MHPYPSCATTTPSSTSTTTTTASAADAIRAYRDALGRAPAVTIAREMQGYIAAGADWSLIVSVLDYTAAAPRPSWYYARAVIRSVMADGVYCAVQFAASCERRRAKRMPDTSYNQRIYDPADVNGLSAEDIAEALKL